MFYYSKKFLKPLSEKEKLETFHPSTLGEFRHPRREKLKEKPIFDVNTYPLKASGVLRQLIWKWTTFGLMLLAAVVKI